MSPVTVDVVLPTQRTPEPPPRRLPRTGGRSRPDCGTCMDLKVVLEDAYDTPDEGDAFSSWTAHMDAAHPNWRSGPVFPPPSPAV